MRSIGMAWTVAAAALLGVQSAGAQSVPGPIPSLPMRANAPRIPMVDQRALFAQAAEKAEVPIGAVEDLQESGDVQTVHQGCDGPCYDPIACYDESCCSSKGGPVKRLKSMLSDWKNGGGACQGYPCANCYAGWDIEKRVVINYVHGNASKPATRISVGDFDGGQLGVEFLPWVLQDGSEVFSRMGFTIMGQYSRLYGNHLSSTQSRLSGGLLNVDSGDMWSLIVAGTYRLDFDFLGVRFSPNALMGGTFDWIDVEPGHYGGGIAKQVDFFNLTGFDCGFYARLMFDVGITEKINIGIGMDFRASHTDVMQDDHDLRKHTGLVLTMSHTF